MTAASPATSKMPAIAVVMPVRNRREVVDRAIQSVLQQDFPDFELIVVDDGSVDGTIEVIKAIADPRLRLICQDGSGANAARNHGIRESRAPLIAFLDSDDAFLPHKLGAVVAAFERQPDLGVLVDSYAIVHPDKHGGEPHLLKNRVIETNAEFLAALFSSTRKSRRLRKATSGMTVRREAALEASLFAEDVDRRQDMEFLARLAKVTRCATTNQILWTKYEQADSISFVGNGFVGATLMMHRLHPEYSMQGRNVPGDIVMYLWETLARKRYGRVAADLKMLAGELGLVSTLSLLARGSWAWFRDGRSVPRD